MKCGEFDKRNDAYFEKFSEVEYFARLIYGEDNLEAGRASRGEAVTIFDVGAHKGESAEFFHEVFPQARIFSFEPTPNNARIIIEKKMPNVFVQTIALSNFEGTAEFNVQDITHLSSLHKINLSSESSMGYAERESHTSIDVEVTRGDLFMRENDIEYIDLLKIDVQANEVSTLDGFSSNLASISVVFVEVSMYDFYEKRSSILRIEETLKGFELYDIYEISKNPKTLGTDWTTLVYKNLKVGK
jgi:FkbM family methyltransferase